MWDFFLNHEWVCCSTFSRLGARLCFLKKERSARPTQLRCLAFEPVLSLDNRKVIGNGDGDEQSYVVKEAVITFSDSTI